MRIAVLTVPGCPNAPVISERLDAVLAGRTAAVDLVEVADEAEAARWRMTGSPTVLVDGVDPFAVPGASASVSCRLYRGPDGKTAGAPSVEELRRVLDAAGEVEDCLADILDPVGRAGRGRLAPVDGGLRAVQQAVLRSFAVTGHAPDAAAVDQVAAAFGRPAGKVLAELAEQDFLTLDEQGQIRAAYPFSAVPTRHRVRIAGGAEVWSMCAIDALGIPPMLSTDAVISSVDPVTGEPVTVTATRGAMAWAPADAVVFVGRRCCTGPAAATCCDALNFFTSPATARQWAAAHPEVTGAVVNQARAEALGRRIFAPLLTDQV